MVLLYINTPTPDAHACVCISYCTVRLCKTASVYYIVIIILLFTDSNEYYLLEKK